MSVYHPDVVYEQDDWYTWDTIPKEVLDQQAERYKSFFEMFRKHKDVITNVTFWGVADDNTWLSELSGDREGRQDFPLLFDVNREPKPALYALLDF